MPSALSRLEATAANTESAVPPTPICVRSRNLHPLDVQAAAQAGTDQPSPKAAWPQEPISPPYATPSFALDPALCGHTFLLSGSTNGVQVLTSPMSSSPNPVSRLAIIPPQFQASGAIHLLSQQYLPNVDPRVDPRMLQQLPSEYGPAAFASHTTDPQLLYNYQLADQRNQSIGWGTRDLVLRSPPLPRQRSAKACKKCRKRKTKCSGGQPCSRCVARGLECEYDEKSTLRGPLKARAESRGRKPASKPASVDGDVRSRVRSQDGDKASSSPGLSCSDKIPSVMQPAPSAAAAAGAREETPQPGTLGGGCDPGQYTAFVSGGSLSESACAPNSAQMSLIQGYVAPDDHASRPRLPSARNTTWPAAPRIIASDISDTSSRPPSACSDYSQSSSDASGYTLSSDASSRTSNASSSPVAWPAAVSDYSYSRVFPRTLASSLSSSSLKDALVPRPRRRAFSQASPLSVETMPADPAHSLSAVLRHATLADSACAPRSPAETSLLGGPGPLAAPGLLSAPPQWGAPPSSLPPTPADTLKFEDVFNFAPESPAHDAGFDALPSRANTVKARDSAQALAHMHMNAAAMMGLDPAHGADGFGFGASLAAPTDLHTAAYPHA